MLLIHGLLGPRATHLPPSGQNLIEVAAGLEPQDLRWSPRSFMRKACPLRPMKTWSDEWSVEVISTMFSTPDACFCPFQSLGIQWVQAFLEGCVVFSTSYGKAVSHPEHSPDSHCLEILKGTGCWCKALWTYSFLSSASGQIAMNHVFCCLWRNL
jgi:hypothetical protein